MGNNPQSKTAPLPTKQLYQSLIPISLTKSTINLQSQITTTTTPVSTQKQKQYIKNIIDLKIILEQFKCSSTGTNALDNKNYFEVKKFDKNIVITKYFEEVKQLQKYFSNLIKISKIMEIVLYDELRFDPYQAGYSTTVTIQIQEYKQLESNIIKNWTIGKKLDLLNFVSALLSKFTNIYICPQFIVESTRSVGFNLLNFSTTQIQTIPFLHIIVSKFDLLYQFLILLRILCALIQADSILYNPQQIFLAFLRYLFTQQASFYTCLTTQIAPTNIPIYIQQLYSQILIKNSLKIKQLHSEIKIIKNKMQLLQNKTDSFYACQHFKKTHKYTSKRNWIFLQIKHEVYFYHIGDLHAFVGKIIRKKKKKQIEQYCLTFDHEELQILWVPENSKYIVKCSQFQFQNNTSVTDIQIKYKLPIKFKNCLIHRCCNGQILLLQHNLYRYYPSTNKVVQQTKKLCDYIFLTATRECNGFIIKSSIDILKNGIRVYYKNQDYILAHAGDQKILEKISSIRIDIRQVLFCMEVYKGVFLMMASRNLWILDLNFQCYFSYAPPNRLNKFTYNLKNTIYNNSFKTHYTNDYIFQILNQPFKVQFPLQSTGNNVAIKDNHLHIIGTIQRNPYYFKYSFMQRIGAIKLQAYQPLYVQSQCIQLNKKLQVKQQEDKDKDYEQQQQREKYSFNFHEQNSQTYKYGNWIFKGQLLLKVYDFKINFERTNYQVHLQIEKIQKTLKRHIQQHLSFTHHNNQKVLQTRPKLQKILLLYRIFTIYQYLFKNSITHRNISINHFVFTDKKQLKLHGWSEPPRNWHVSDYKDYLLVCFNIITGSTYQKVSDKITDKFQNQLNKYQTFAQKIHTALKQSKNIEKRAQIQKNLLCIKNYLQKQLSAVLQSQKSSNYIFAPQFHTPRISIFNITTNKLAKITIIPQENINQEFIFNQTDKYVWNQEWKKLYIFTISHQFFQIKVQENNESGANASSTYNGGIVEKKICVQDYQYLPINVSSSSFVGIKNAGLYSFGGIKKQMDGRSVYNYKIFKFNWNSLAWDVVGQIPQPRIDPHVIPSICNRYIYIFGQKSIENPNLSLIKFDTLTNSCLLLHSPLILNIASHQNNFSPMRIFHINEPLSIFMYFSLEDNNYIIRYISYSSIGFNIELKLKNYSSDNIITSQSIAYQGNTVHLLRMYGKYSKIIINKLQGLSVNNQTIYAI